MAAASAKFNVRNPGVKRILQEMKELQAETNPDFIADALEEDIFEWHFVIRGPPDTEFEGGIFHGRILLPAEYPFKPPAFMMLTPNGRFQTGVKICLSISSHHPEHWQPSWSVRTALTALIAFMPSPGQGALGSLDFTKDERRQLAAKSASDVPKFGSPARQKVINDMHQRFLELQKKAAAAAGVATGVAKAGSDGTVPTVAAATAAAGAAVVAANVAADTKDATPPRSVADQGAAAVAAVDNGSGGTQQLQQQLHSVFSLGSNAVKEQQLQQQPPGDEHNQQQQREHAVVAVTGKPGVQGNDWSSSSSINPMSPPAAAPVAATAAVGHWQQQQQQQLGVIQAAGRGNATLPGELPSDRGLTYLAAVLAVAIAAMLLKKVVVAFGVPAML